MQYIATTIIYDKRISNYTVSIVAVLVSVIALPVIVIILVACAINIIN